MPRRAAALFVLPVLLAAPVAAQATWTDRTTASTPAFLRDSALACDPVRRVLVLFGGWSSSTGASNDTWEWDGTVWTLRSFAIEPTARFDHAMAFDSARGVTVMCGGVDFVPTYQPTTWEYDGSSWVLRHIASSIEAVSNHRMAFDPNRGQVIRFGGYTRSGTSSILNPATHAWTGTTWTLLTTGGPAARVGHMMATDEARRRVVLFGGSVPGATSDTWEWTGTWWQRRLPAHVPPVRWGGGLAWTGSGRKLALFGGQDSINLSLGDTWTWDGSDWTRIFPAGGPGPRTRFEFAYDERADCAVLIDDGIVPGVPPGPPLHWELRVPVQAPGSFTPFGAGCTSSAGVPQLAAAPGSLPFLGDPFTVRLTGIPGSIYHLAFLLSGFSATTWNGAPLPQELSGYGMSGCFAWIAPEAAELLLNLGGVATKTWTIPLAPALVGVEFHSQGAVLDPGINAASFALSNAGTVRIGQM